MGDRTPDRPIRPAAMPALPARLRPPPLQIPVRRNLQAEFNNAVGRFQMNRPFQHNPGGSPGRRKGGRTRRHKKKLRKTRRKY